MAVGQGALRGGWDVVALDAVETRLEVLGVEQCFAHARLLRDVLELHRLHSAADCGLSTVPQLGLLPQISEGVARNLLAEAQLLTSLPGGLEALECGLLTVAQSAALLRAVGELDADIRLIVWRRLQARLLAVLDEGSVLTPARLASLLARWVIAADPAAAEARRRQAEAGGDVSYRRRADGLGDLSATAVPSRCCTRCCAGSGRRLRRSGADDRSAGKRRVDALVDLILGREQRHLPADPPAAAPAGGDSADVDAPPAARVDAGGGQLCASGCGCRLDAPVPCGAQRWCTSRSARPSARPTSWLSSSGTDRCTLTSCMRCCTALRSCKRCTSTPPACRSASTSGSIGRRATTKPRCARRC